MEIYKNDLNKDWREREWPVPLDDLGNMSDEDIAAVAADSDLQHDALHKELAERLLALDVPDREEIFRLFARYTKSAGWQRIVAHVYGRSRALEELKEEMDDAERGAIDREFSAVRRLGFEVNRRKKRVPKGRKIH